MGRLGILAFLTLTVDGFYVPGVAPMDFEKEDKVEIKAVKMTSSKTQLPYEYYSLPMCKPDKVSKILLQRLRVVSVIIKLIQRSHRSKIQIIGHDFENSN